MKTGKSLMVRLGVGHGLFPMLIPVIVGPLLGLGYHPWLETEGRSGVGKPQEMDTIRIEGTDLTMPGVLPPEGFWLSKNPL